jgi:anti-sigma factor RsiW
MTDHTRYEELTALAAGGHLSVDEYGELQEHLAICSHCRTDAQELRRLVRSGLPLTKEFSASLDNVNAVPAEGARDRLLARARSEGFRFSPSIDKREPIDKAESPPWLPQG